MSPLAPPGAVRRTPWRPEAVRADPLGFLAEERAAQRALARLLETLADALPDGAEPAASLLAAARLRQVAMRAQPREALALYGLAERAAPPTAAAPRIVALARREAATVAGLALELADELETLARGRGAEPEALGFMLRACFEALLRRLDWVEAAILPQARAALDATALAAMGEALAASVARTPLSERAGLAVAPRA